MSAEQFVQIASLPKGSRAVPLPPDSQKTINPLRTGGFADSPRYDVDDEVLVEGGFTSTDADALVVRCLAVWLVVILLLRVEGAVMTGHSNWLVAKLTG